MSNIDRFAIDHNGNLCKTWATKQKHGRSYATQTGSSGLGNIAAVVAAGAMAGAL
jgi:hypothetical protein